MTEKQEIQELMMFSVFIFCSIKSTQYTVTKLKIYYLQMYVCIPMTAVPCLSKVKAKALTNKAKAID